MAKRSKKRMTQEDRRRKYLVWGMTAFVGIILTTSLFVIAFQLSPNSQANAQRYGDITFRIDRQQGLYVFDHEGVEHRTTALPQEVESIPVPDAWLAQARNASRITIARSSVPDQALALSAYLLTESLTRSGSYAVTQGYTDRDPLVNCSQATASNPIILFESSNTTELSAQDACLTVEYADQYGALLGKNAVMYRLLGIIR